jgi:outer membrane protein, protease secretion system
MRGPKLPQESVSVAGRWVKALVPAMLLLAAATSARAQDDGANQYLTLNDAMAQALQHDPEYRAAVYGQQAGAEFAALGRAALLPSVQLGGNIARNRQDRKVDQGQLGRIDDTRFFESNNLNVRLTQPLYSVDNLGRYQDGMARAELSAQTFATEVQELKARVVERYTNVLFATERVRILDAEGEALMHQTRVAQRRFDRGEATRLEVSQVRTAMERWRADILGARGALAQARQALAASIGPSAVGSRTVVFDARDAALPFGAADFDTWMTNALAVSPAVKAAEGAIGVAQAEVTRARGQRLPRLDAYASYSSSDSDTAVTVGQSYDTSSVGLQVSMPLFLGGAAQANLRQAQARLFGARAERDAEVGRITLELRQLFDQVRALGQQHRALLVAAEAAADNVRAAELGVAGGTDSLGDVLTVMRTEREVQIELLDARYSWVNAYARLHALSGLLDDHAIAHMSTALQGKAAAAPPPVVPLSEPAAAPATSTVPRLKLSPQLKMGGAIEARP